jgi:hypothetical protein
MVMLITDQEKMVNDRLERAKNAVKNANDELAKLASRKQELTAIPDSDSRYPAAQLELDRITNEKELAAKNALTAAEAVLETTQKETGDFQSGLESRKGDIHVNDNADQADWSDLFRGELVSNFRVVDPGKVQMFFLTIILVFTYGTMVWGVLGAEATWQAESFVNLPAFSDSMVALLGISHLGYLAIKQTGD